MQRISMNDLLNYAYRVISGGILGMKASVINLCSDIDRYFILSFGVSISDDVNENTFAKIRQLYPHLADMSLELFNKYLSTIASIRNLNAHLHLCLPVYLDSEVEEYLINVVTPTYKISVNGKLTVYGQAYILNFLSQKYNIWPFVTSYYKKKLFVDFEMVDGKAVSEFQQDQQHLLQNYCGVGKPIYPDGSKSMDWQYMNELFKLHMTRIIYYLEKESLKTSRSFSHTWSLSRGLNNTYTFMNNPETLDLIIFLRNCWFHGTNLNDYVVYNGSTIKLDYTFVFESFIQIKKCLINNWENYDSVIKELNEFASDSLNFYALRLVEVSYKLLDKDY